MSAKARVHETARSRSGRRATQFEPLDLTFRMIVIILNVNALHHRAQRPQGETSPMNGTYDPRSTAILLVDPYNDFTSEGGKLWPRLQEVAEDVGLVDNLRAIVKAARNAAAQVVFVPHHRWEETSYQGWRFVNASQAAARDMRLFARGEWGGQFHPDLQPTDGDVVAGEHWGQNGFANTDLDLQLKQHGISHVVVIGFIANTCVEATARYAMELGYHVTLVRDATSAFGDEYMRAAHDLNGPTYAHAITTTKELLQNL